MPFIYTPSIYGFAGALIFLILGITELQSDRREWLDVATWGLLGVAFLLKHIPKFIVLRMLNLVATALLALGLVLFLYQHLPEISG
jgi:CHASE2 domain-containing sensor protein